MELEDAYWPEAHRNPDKMVKLASAAHRLCGLDNITIPFDLVVEAEILGAPINFHDGKILWPSVKNFKIKEISDITIPSDITTLGRVSIICQAIKALKKEYEGKVPIIVAVTPPFTSISSYLVETTSFLLSIITDPNKIHEYMKVILPLYKELSQVYTEAGADIITFHEMGASTRNISPQQFETFVQPYLKELFQNISIPKILNICGTAEMIVDNMLTCKPDALAFDENTSITKTKELLKRNNSNTPMIGNIPSYDILYKGTHYQIHESVKKALIEGVNIIAPGCDFYLETSVENIKIFVDAARKYTR